LYFIEFKITLTRGESAHQLSSQIWWGSESLRRYCIFGGGGVDGEKKKIRTSIRKPKDSAYQAEAAV
jgi:hypothetical protein